MRPQTAFRASAGRFMSAAGENVVGRREAARRATARRMTRSSDRPRSGHGPALAAQSEAAQAPMEDLSVFYKVEVPAERLDELRAQLADDELIEAAFVKPPSSCPGSTTWPPRPKSRRRQRRT